MNVLRLYVNDMTPRSQEAIAMMEAICRNELAGQFTLEIIDVNQHPDLAETDKILATPTLIKALPPPLRRLVGDLSEREKVLAGLAVYEV